MKEPRVIVITGASAGIGRATARAFAHQKANVALLARGAEGLEATRQEVVKAGGKALAIPTDVADYEQVAAAANQVVGEWGKIDVWVNNAVSTVFCSLDGIDPEQFKRATEVSYLGVVWGTMVALKHMKPYNHGKIIQVGSALAYRSIPLQTPYCGAKSAIRGFTDALRSELIHDRFRIQLTMMQLSGMNTPLYDWVKTCWQRQPQPVLPYYEPEVAASAIVWASKRNKREVWVGVPATAAILSNRFIAPVMDHVLAWTAYPLQKAGRPIEGVRPDNLFEPVPGDFGARGRFSRKALPISVQTWLTRLLC